MFDDRIRKQGGDEYVIRSAVRVHGGDGGVEAGHACLLYTSDAADE